MTEVATLVSEASTYISLGLVTAIVVLIYKVTRLIGRLESLEKAWMETWSFHSMQLWVGDLRRLNRDIVIPDPSLWREREKS